MPGDGHGAGLGMGSAPVRDVPTGVAPGAVGAGLPGGLVPAGEVARGGPPPLRGQLAPPALPVPYVPRPRLWEILDHGTGRALTVVRGPAGCGKTTLVASWYLARRDALPMVWLRVDPAASPGRDEPTDPSARPSLWEHLLVALARHPHLGADVAAGRLSSPRPGAPVDEFCRALAGVLSRARPAPLVLVIDDVGLVRDEADIAGLNLLAAEATGTRLVLCGRRMPVATHRARAAGQLTEIGPDLLAFDAEETRRLLAALRLPAAAGPGLLAATEGWAAGLRLVAAGLASPPPGLGDGTPAIPAGSASLAASPRTAGMQVPAAAVRAQDGRGASAHPALPTGAFAPVTEYLRAEALGALPAPVRPLLLRTSVLDQVCPPLAEAVVAEPGGADRLFAQLAAGEVLATPLAPPLGTPPGTAATGAGEPADPAAGVPWFRYHDLLRVTLREALRRDPTEDETELNLRAALWYAAHRRLVDAARHAHRAGDWRYLACLVTRGPVPLIVQGDLPDLAVLAADFPDRAAALGPECATVAALARVLAGDIATAGEHLDLARAGMGGGPVAGAAGGTWSGRAAHEPAGDGLAGVTRRSLLMAIEAVELRRADLAGDVDAMVDAARRSLRMRTVAPYGPAEGLPDGLRALALGARGRAELWRGRLDSAEDALRAALAEARWVRLGGAAASCLGALALGAALRGRLRLAEETAAAALATLTGPGDGQPGAPDSRPQAEIAGKGEPDRRDPHDHNPDRQSSEQYGSHQHQRDRDRQRPEQRSREQQGPRLPGSPLPGSERPGLAGWPGPAGSAAPAGAAEAFLALAVVAGYRGDTASGLARVTQAAQAAGPGQGGLLPDLANLLRAWLHLGRRGADDLRAARRALGAVPARERPALLVALRETTQADLLVAGGNPDAALRLLERDEAVGWRDGPTARLARGRAQLAQGDAVAAELTVAPLLRADGGGVASVVGACAVSALAAARRGDGAQAGGLLARAFALAQDEPLVRPLLELGGEVVALTDAHPGLSDAAPELVAVLRAALAREPRRRSAQPAGGARPVEAAGGARPAAVPAARRAPVGPGGGRPAPAPRAEPATRVQRWGSGEGTDRAGSAGAVPGPVNARTRAPAPALGGAGGDRAWVRPAEAPTEAPNAPSPRPPLGQVPRASGQAGPAGGAEPAGFGSSDEPPRPAGGGVGVGVGPRDRQPSARAARGPDRLSERELAVLSYLPTMLTTAEIAAELFVSVNTVKTHLKSIYRKLDVARRRDAVHRARALHLL